MFRRDGRNQRVRRDRRTSFYRPMRHGRAGSLPILKSGIYFGEIYDARLEDGAAPEGSEVLAFDDSCSFRKKRRRCANSRHSPRCAVAGRAKVGRSTILARTPPAMLHSPSKGRRAPGSLSSTPKILDQTRHVRQGQPADRRMAGRVHPQRRRPPKDIGRYSRSRVFASRG